MFDQSKLFPGNRLEQYMPKTEAASHRAVISSLLTRRGNNAADSIISKIRTDPSKFDRDVAAIRDLIAEAHAANNIDDVKRYEDLLDRVVGKSFPGRFSISSGESQAMRTVLSQSLPAGHVNASPISPMTAKEADISSRLANIKRSKNGRTRRIKALDDLAEELYGVRRSPNATRVQSARVAVADIPIFQHLDQLGDQLTEEVFDVARDPLSHTAQRRVVDEANTEKILNRLYRLRDGIYDEAGNVDSKKIEEIRELSEKLIPTKVDAKGRTIRTAVTDEVKAIDDYFWNAAQKRATGSQDVIHPLADEQVDWLGTVARKNILEDRRRNMGSVVGGLESGSYGIEEINMLDDNVPEFMDTAAGRKAAEQYAELGRMKAKLGGDADIDSMIGYMQSRVVTKFSMTLDPELRSQAEYFLGGYARGRFNQNATTRAAAMWADAANRMHGGVRIRNTQGIRSSLVSRQFVGMRGLVTNVTERGYTVALGGFSSGTNRLVMFNEMGLIGTAQQLKMGASWDVDASLDSMRKLAAMTASQRAKEEALLRSVATESYNRIHMTISASPKNIEKLERVYESSNLHPFEKDIIEKVVKLRRKGVHPTDILEELRSGARVEGYTLLDVSNALAKASKFMSSTDGGRTMWHIESIANTTGAISQAVEGGLSRVDDLAGHETMHAMSIKPSKAAEDFVENMKIEMARNKTTRRLYRNFSVPVGEHVPGSGVPRVYSDLEKMGITHSELRDFTIALRKHRGTDAEIDIKKLVDYAMNSDGTLNRDRFAMIVGEMGTGKPNFFSFAGSVAEEDVRFLNRTYGEAQKALHVAIEDSAKMFDQHAHTDVLSVLARDDRSGIFTRMRALVKQGKLTQKEFDKWSSTVLSSVVGRFDVGTNDNARLEELADQLAGMDVSERSSMNASVSLQQLMHEGEEGERAIQDVVGDVRILNNHEVTMRGDYISDFMHDIGEASDYVLDDFTKNLDNLDSEARRIAEMGVGNAQRRAYYQRYWLGSIYDRMKGLGDDEARSGFSKIMASSAEVAGLRDLEFSLVDTVKPEDGLSSESKTMLAVFGWDEKSGERRALLWEMREDHKGRTVARAVSEERARSLRVLTTVGHDDAAFANETVSETLETLNMKLAANGLEMKDFEEAGKRLMPGMHAKTTVDEMLRAASDIEANAPSLSKIDLDAVMSSGFDSAGNAIEANSRKSLSIVDSIVEAAYRIKGGHAIDEPFIRQMGGIETMMNANIAATRIGGLPSEFVEIAKNMKTARGLDPLEQIKELGHFGASYPRIAKLAVGAIAITGMGIAARALDHDANRTEEFLKYDHPGSEGIARVAPNGTGYDVAGMERGVPSPVGQASVANSFKGTNTIINVRDNLDGMSPNTVNRMAGGM